MKLAPPQSIASALLRMASRPMPDRQIRNLVRALRRKVRRDRAYNILGICSTGHGASMALVSSHHGIRAMNLERFLAKKYALLLAREELHEIENRIGSVGAGIRFVLSNRDGSMPPTAVFEEIWEEWFSSLLHGLPLSAKDMDMVVGSESHFAINRAWQGRALSRYFPNASVYTDLEHHAVHRYQAFFASGFEDSAVLTADACGEPLLRHGGSPLAMTLSHASGHEFNVLEEHRYPSSSPGALYGFINHHLGFDAGEEGKTMGLSSFGIDTLYQKMRPSLTLHENGSFEFLSKGELLLFLHQQGIPEREPQEPITRLHEDLAKAAQLLLEDIMINAARALKRHSSSTNLCLAGGTALNSVANEKAFRASGFQNLYIMPNAGDCGHALGCALFAERTLLRTSTSCSTAVTNQLPFTDALGPHYSDEETVKAIVAAGFPLQRLQDAPGHAAKLISEGKIVGWFQGGSEFGPRSLGQRSLLADPRSPKMKDHLNDRVKHREAFRPFAPAVLEERAGEYFDLLGHSPFMLRVVDVIFEKRESIPAVTHVDGTARVQTVRQQTNPRFYALIVAFEAITGIPVVLNTSFNVAGKPIVETPQNAIECFQNTAIDVLIMHDFILEKNVDVLL